MSEVRITASGLKIEKPKKRQEEQLLQEGAVSTQQQYQSPTSKAPTQVAQVQTLDDIKNAKQPREMLLGHAQNMSFKNNIMEMYRNVPQDKRIGDGGIADALRYEIKNNTTVGGVSHEQKVKERIRHLEKISESKKLGESDKAIAKILLKDLTDALSLKK